MYAITELDTEFWRITLPMPQLHGHLPAADPVHVYLLGGRSPALVNAGHLTTSRALRKGIEATGYCVSSIERIVATSWDPEILGGARAFPHADLFVLSPDMIAPRDYDTWLSKERARFEAMVQNMKEDPRFEALDEEVTSFLDVYFAPVSGQLSFVPLRHGHLLALGTRRFEVIAAPGPNPGHMALFDSTHGMLFIGDLVTSGLPPRVTNISEYLTALERTAGTDATALYPNRGSVDTWGAFSLKRSGRFLNNFLTHTAQAMGGAPTLLDFVERDLGYLPSSHPVRLASTLLVYSTFLDEMVRTGQLDARGQGWSRRYGVDFDEA